MNKHQRVHQVCVHELVLKDRYARATPSFIMLMFLRSACTMHTDIHLMNVAHENVEVSGLMCTICVYVLYPPSPAAFFPPFCRTSQSFSEEETIQIYFNVQPSSFIANKERKCSI